MLNTGYNKQSFRTNVTQQFAQALSITGEWQLHPRPHAPRHQRERQHWDQPVRRVLVHAAVHEPQPCEPGRRLADQSVRHRQPFADAVDIPTPQEVSRFIGSGSVQWTPWKTDHQSLQFNAVGGADLTSYRSLLYAPPTLQVEQQIATGLPGASVSNDATINYFNYSLNLVHHYTGLSWLDATTAIGFARERRNLSNPVTIGYATARGGQRADGRGRAEQLLLRDGREGSVALRAGANPHARLSAVGHCRCHGREVDAERRPSTSSTRTRISPRRIASRSSSASSTSFKVRAAYGQSGNLGTYGTKYTPYVPVLIDNREAVTLPATLGDSTLKPESEQEIELGFDATMLKSRAQFSATVYQKRLTSLLLAGRCRAVVRFCQPLAQRRRVHQSGHRALNSRRHRSSCGMGSPG